MTTTHAGGVEAHLEVYVRAFNSGDPDAVNEHYTDEAVSAWDPAQPLSGQARKDSLAEFLALKPTLTAKIRESHVTRDTALLTVDWTMEVPGEDGEVERLTGIGTDVLTRGADGNWRYAVDAPYGDPRNTAE
ncbi:YybH family protein [Streptomyces eurythermus]|uniref:YybH family protein n=1 Tax=Streptomyces eurythermus TaxID=42237 RepID=UPI0036CF6182